MRTRRSVLTVIGAAALAGCSSTTAGTQSNSEQEIEEQDVYLPLDGLGQFGEKVLDADMENSEFTAEGIQTLLEPADNVDQEAELLAEITTPDNLYQVSNAYLSTKKEEDNVVAVNQNHAFYQDSGPLLEFHTIRNGELQGQPGLKAQGKTHFPGDQGPEYLTQMRDPTNGASAIPQDYQALQSWLESEKRYGDDGEQGVRDERAATISKMSNSIIGIGSDEKFMYFDGESANLVAGAIQGENPESAQALAELSNQYPEAPGFGTDTWTSAQYTEDGWKFETRPDYKLGDKLPGEQ
jgi:hypothetical protein